jgi:RND family efflux transporter MFP subunit
MILCKWVFAASIVGVALAVEAMAIGSAAAETFDCVMEPSLVVELGGPVPGLLASVLVKRGDKIVRNRVVAKLNSKVEEATVKLLAEQADNSAEVDAQKARVDLAVSQAERARKLAEHDITSKQKLEEVVSQMKVAERELALAEMRRRVAQLELERAETTLDQRAIRSPIDGIVTVRNLYGGEYLDQNGKVATIAQLDPLNVETYLPVAFFGRVKVGMDVKVVPAPPFEGSYVGTVSVVDRVFDAASGTFGVRIILPNSDLQLPAGQRCKASFFELSNYTNGLDR